jgi:hypothetical protein
MRAHEALAAACGLLALSGKQQPGTWLPHAGFHALIGRIFSAALKCNFDTGGIVRDLHLSAGRDKAFLAQSSSHHFERQDQVIGFPLKRLRGI